MAWWDRLFGHKTHAAKVLFQLYTQDGTRGAEVRLQEDGKFYFVPLEHIGGTDWKVIPGRITVYRSEQEAESAAVNSPWFLRGERPLP